MREHIISNDGEILGSLSNPDRTATSTTCRLFLLIPHCHQVSDIPSVEHFSSPPDIVTDMWAERCLQSKKFVEPNEHVLSRPIRVFPIPGFEKLIINSTGLANIDLLHVSKAVNLLGARYDEVLKTGISILLCNSSKAGQEKLRHAGEWGIPVVSVEWLWACVRSGQMKPFRAFLLKQEQNSKRIISNPNAVNSARHPEAVQIGGRDQVARNGEQTEFAHPVKEPAKQDSFPNDAGSHHTSRAPRGKLIAGEGFMKSPHRKEKGSELRKDREVVATDQVAAPRRHESRDDCDKVGEEVGTGLPLQEISTNSPPKPERAASPKGQLFRRFDSQTRLPHRDQDDDALSAPKAISTVKSGVPPRAESINGAIKELLSKSKAKSTAPTICERENKKKRLLGRAPSNMSNSSREGSNIRASRASSIDSVNTDGLGSVTLDETSQVRRTGAGAGIRTSFTGRASAQERGINECSLELGDAALYHEEYQQEEDVAPQMTQLGYDNPEDAVAFREMLAERRRNRSRRGQEDVKLPNPKEGKRIKDDVILAPGGWGTGRRTRQRVKSP